MNSKIREEMQGEKEDAGFISGGGNDTWRMPEYTGKTTDRKGRRNITGRNGRHARRREEL